MCADEPRKLGKPIFARNAVPEKHCAKPTHAAGEKSLKLDACTQPDGASEASLRNSMSAVQKGRMRLPPCGAGLALSENRRKIRSVRHLRHLFALLPFTFILGGFFFVG
jgi:hypothetical protein